MIRGEKGLTLLEATVALFILGIVLTGLVPSFLAFTDVNTMNEARSGAIQAAQTKMESLRTADFAVLDQTPATLPLETFTVGSRNYDVEVQKCQTPPGLCSSTSRHFVVEVQFDGRVLYTAETVFTEMR